MIFAYSIMVAKVQFLYLFIYDYIHYKM